MKRWGMTLPLEGISLADHKDVVAEIEDLGYTDVWTSEIAGTDAFTPLALTAVWSSRLRVGTAIVPVYTRGPGLLAMHAASLAEIAPDRFVLGIGSSSPVIVNKWNSMPFEAPFGRVRDTLHFLRSALAGERVTVDDSTLSVAGFALERKPVSPPPIVLAALRPTMLKLAAEAADGAITTWLSAGDVKTVRSVLGPDPELIARLFVIPTADTEQARAIARRLLAGYLTVPAYAAFHEWLGRGDELVTLHMAWAEGDRKTASASIPDHVVDALVVHGSPGECRDKILAFVDNGLDTPVIQIVPPSGDADQLQAIRDLAPR